MIRADDLAPNMLVPYYLMASYLYYCENESLMPDGEYDKICQYLDEMWDLVEHRHKHIIDRAALSATTGYHMREEAYPLIVRSAARRLLTVNRLDSLTRNAEIVTMHPSSNTGNTTP